MSLEPVRYKLSAWENATFRKLITVYTGDTDATPLWNFTGYTATMSIYSAPEVTPALYTLDTNNGGITLGGIAGTVALYIPAATTASFAWTAGVYELLVVDAGGSGDSTVLLFGPFIVRGLT